MKSKKRSNQRLFLGRIYYIKDSKLYPKVIFQHQTPLLRKIYPGETFSYWKFIGKATKRKGNVEGMVLNQGSFTPGIVGGVMTAFQSDLLDDFTYSFDCC